MKRILFFALVLLAITACHKEVTIAPTVPTYTITLQVSGKGNYNYQIGSKYGSGHSDSSVTITGTTKPPASIDLGAHADGTGSMCISIETSPHASPYWITSECYTVPQQTLLIQQ